VIYKRLILTAFCLRIIYFPANGNCADKENIEEWYIVSRHGDYMPLKTIFAWRLYAVKNYLHET